MKLQADIDERHVTCHLLLSLTVLPCRNLSIFIIHTLQVGGFQRICQENIRNLKGRSPTPVEEYLLQTLTNNVSNIIKINTHFRAHPSNPSSLRRSHQISQELISLPRGKKQPNHQDYPGNTLLIEFIACLAQGIGKQNCLLLVPGRRTTKTKRGTGKTNKNKIKTRETSIW